MSPPLLSAFPRSVGMAMGDWNILWDRYKPPHESQLWMKLTQIAASKYSASAKFQVLIYQWKLNIPTVFSTTNLVQNC